MKKLFYYFPFKKDVPFILYDSHEVFNSPVFISLYNKISGKNSWRLILRKKPFVSLLFEKLFKKIVTVPLNEVRIIYHGYDNTFFFCLDNDLRVTKLYTETDGVFTEEEYLGATVDIYNYSKLKADAPKLIEFFQNRWEKLKKGEISIHGDLTTFNICFDNDKVSLIDAQPHKSDSIIFDRLYFFAYSKDRIKRRRYMGRKSKERIELLLKNLILSSFPKEDYPMVIKLAQKLILKNSPSINNFEAYRDEFIDLFKESK